MRRPSPHPLRLPLLAAGLLMSAAVPATAQGAPRSMAECERLKNDLAYNQCLAMFGPPARNVGGGDGAAASAPPVTSTATIPGIPSIEEPAVEETGRRGRRGRHARRGGRMSASFDVSSAGDEVVDGSETTRSRHRRRRR